ncbi:chemotaxis protein CheD [Halobacillus litoralis]|uniref:chemotaxis protein CheD n=1 Tax=Halobacillus litoralis TaxID=45668 RepID=UPI001CFD74A1|nr:chemotaxis protein CheD [Halobacillus litoralis]
MSEVKRCIRIGIGEMGVGRASEMLKTSGLGSCIGIVLYDEVVKLAGMAHIMLPDSGMARKNRVNRAKYADTALIDLMDSLQEAGAVRWRLKAKIAGGAQMFSYSGNSSMMRIGMRNIEAVRSLLKQFSIPVIAEDVGGTSGRTIEFDPDTGTLRIKTVYKGVHEL